MMVGNASLKLDPLTFARFALGQAHVVSLKPRLSIPMKPPMMNCCMGKTCICGFGREGRSGRGRVRRARGRREWRGRRARLAVLPTWKKSCCCFNWKLFTCVRSVRWTVSEAVVAVFKARLEGKLVRGRGSWWVLV